ncbi:hypothetical protein SAMN05192558_105420 [Actinokineospora alba]|uniref:RelA/SpoT domain-containing protein n=1 Tax=Actinokineospora alba TaxID=504798 RepID=A0A1H0NPE4_9PSEU|nr:hypothetical protein [Actinokineospora alba]TDP68789.1 RelA/SpoT family protein [Actinokineospora alba]SDH86696.1 hypothetical protein SAMN05421871_102470 [Actinokineospora alba]SDO94418.1 hypothetical protein SAMN05192558_105420 [Actinokineospora alba]
MPSEAKWTKSQIARLGKNLTKSNPSDPQHIEQLHDLLSIYDESLSEAVELVQSTLSINATPRVKNTGTILEKLKRSGGGSLPNIQDLAGMRIVLDIDWIEQDRIVADLRELFTTSENKKPKEYDRRVTPLQGYRAVHLVVFHNNLPVEIQIRTKLQHQWANLYEKLADIVGRGIRYGERPERWTTIIDTLAKTRGGQDVTSDSEASLELIPSIINVVQRQADEIAAHEFASTLAKNPSFAETLPMIYESLPTEIQIDENVQMIERSIAEINRSVTTLTDLRAKYEPLFTKVWETVRSERVLEVARLLTAQLEAQHGLPMPEEVQQYINNYVDGKIDEIVEKLHNENELPGVH